MTKNKSPKPAPTVTPDPATPPTPTPVATTGNTAAAKPRIKPEITQISTAVEMPVRVNNRGSKTLYPFDDLPVGGSFGVKNKTAAGLASIISNQNRKNMVEEKDENGNTVFETQELKGVDGTITKVPTEKPQMVREKHFFANDTTADADPDNATVRVFRDL